MNRIVINRASGGVPQDGVLQLQSLLKDLGGQASIHECDGESLKDCIDANLDCDRLVVWGGDGTVAYALAASGMAGPPVLPLPGGTMNLLHRHVHHGMTDWREILASALEADSVMTLPAGDISGHRFYVAALFGRLTELVEPREAIREGDIVGAARALLDSQMMDLDTLLEIDPHRKQERSATAAGVFVKPEQFDIGLIDPDTLGELLHTGLEAALGNWRDATGVEFLRTTALTVRHREEDRFQMTLDGEAMEAPGSARVRFIPDAARVIAAPVS